MKKGNMLLWTDADIHALMEPEVRRMAGLTGPVDFPRLRAQGRGQDLDAIYADLSERILGVDVRPLAAVERAYRTKYAPLLAVRGQIDSRRHPPEALRFPGYRAMQAVAAMEPDWQGVAGKFGMYLLSHALWLADEMRRGNFDRLLFLARDGKLVKSAFDAVNTVLQIPVETDYVRISRQAAFPLHFRTAADLLQLPVLIDPAAHTPRTLLALFSPVVEKSQAAAALLECGLLLDKHLDEASVARFTEVFRTRLYDEARFAAYRAQAKNYLAPFFTGRCATCDVGYNLRSESVIADVTGAEITAFITHTDSDLPDRRGIPYRTLYPVSPYVSWVAREQFLLTKGDPPCIRYGEHGPVLGDDAASCPEMKRIQRRALAYVRRVVELFREDLTRLPFRPVDGCIPFERYLHAAPRREIRPLRSSEVENAFHAGAGKEETTFLQWQLMQTDCRRHVLREPEAWIKLRRAFIRLREDPGSFAKKLKRR